MREKPTLECVWQQPPPSALSSYDEVAKERRWLLPRALPRCFARHPLLSSARSLAYHIGKPVVKKKIGPFPTGRKKFYKIGSSFPTGRKARFTGFRLSTDASHSRPGRRRAKNTGTLPRGRLSLPRGGDEVTMGFPASERGSLPARRGAELQFTIERRGRGLESAWRGKHIVRRSAIAKRSGG